MKVILVEIHKGMKVFDRSRKQIGKVEDFHFGANEIDPEIEPSGLGPIDREGQGSFIATLGEVFTTGELPQELQERLLTEGYVKLDTQGLFAADRYILSEQIDSADADHLFLNVDRQALIEDV